MADNPANVLNKHGDLLNRNAPADNSQYGRIGDHAANAGIREADEFDLDKFNHPVVWEAGDRMWRGEVVSLVKGGAVSVKREDGQVVTVSLPVLAKNPANLKQAPAEKKASFQESIGGQNKTDQAKSKTAPDVAKTAPNSQGNQQPASTADQTAQRTTAPTGSAKTVHDTSTVNGPMSGAKTQDASPTAKEAAASKETSHHPKKT